MKTILVTIAVFFLFGCVSLDTVSVTSIPAHREKVVKSSVEKFMFMGFNFDNDYVDALTDKLKNQCVNGSVSGILTKDETTNYFLYIFWKKNITAQGYCVQNKNMDKVQVGKGNKRNPSDENSTETNEVNANDSRE